jgi:hypothetical protein
LRCFAVDVGDGNDLGLRQMEGERFSMHTADAASAYDSDVKLFLVQWTLT